MFTHLETCLTDHLWTPMIHFPVNQFIRLSDYLSTFHVFVIVSPSTIRKDANGGAALQTRPASGHLSNCLFLLICRARCFRY